MSLSAPYRFVPASKVVLFPDWADQVSHDMPFEDGVCGELSIQLNCDTPLCVGGSQDKSTDNTPGRVHFFRTPDNHPAIPGSSIKGMLRNVLEIASFARFKQVEDKRLGVRDLSTGVKFYKDLITKQTVYAGWLSFNKEESMWQVQPCEFSRISDEQLIAILKPGKSQKDWDQAKTDKNKKRAFDFYELFNEPCTEVRFQTTKETVGKKPESKLVSSGGLIGNVVVTGKPNPGKKHEFIFHQPNKPVLPVAQETMNGFLQIHEESKEWSEWKDLQSSNALPRGIPIFFHKSDSDSIKSMGLAMMYKLPYENSLHDAIRHTLTDHLDSEQPDLPDLIFGYLGDDHPGQNRTQWGARGRVNIGLAELAQPVGALRWHGPMILSSPKPTFYPAYIRQYDGSEQPQQLMEETCELAGWKRYPAKTLDLQPIPDDLKKNKKIQTSLETVPKGSVFNFKIRFHNLRRVELGALLWSLDFGNKPECRHGLGIGKPFGFGQVGLTVTGSKMRANDGSDVCEQKPAQYLKACRVEFDQLMSEFLKQSGNSWHNCNPVKELQHMATPESHRLQLLPLRYMELEDFSNGKNADNLQDVFDMFHSGTPVEVKAETEQNSQPAHTQIKTSTTAEDSLTQKIEKLASTYHSKDCTKTTKDNLAKELGNAHKQQEQLSGAQQSEVVSLVLKMNEPPSSKLGKIIKKILRDFTKDDKKTDT
jgi:CRISPR-associated protein (TIGR03986 family)